MSIIWCGAEDIDFVNGYVYPGSGSWSGLRYIMQTGSRYEYSPNFSTTLPLWLQFKHFRWIMGITIGTQVGLKFASGVHLGIGVYDYGGGTWVWDNGFWTIGISQDRNTWTQLATEETMSYESSGATRQENLYFELNGNTLTIKKYNYTNMLNLNVNVDVSGYDLSTVTNVFFQTVANTGGQSIGGILLASQDTRLMGVETLYPNSNGDINQWTNDYTNIDEASINDTDIIYSNTNDSDFLCNISNLPTTQCSIYGLKISNRSRDQSLLYGIQSGIKTNGSTYLNSTKVCQNIFYNDYVLFQNNPITSVNFTPEEINSLQLNLRCKTV